VLLGIIGERLI